MALDPRRARRLIVAAVLLGCCARLAFALVYWVDKPMTHDEREYLALGGSLASGAGFVYPEWHEVGTGQRFGRAPGYPVFLAALGAGRAPAEHAPVRVKVAQSIVGGLIVWLIGLLALGAAGPRAGVVAAAIAAVYPPLVWMPAYVLSETLYSALALTSALVLQRAADRSTATPGMPAAARLAGAGGLIAGAASLVRPAMLFFLPLAFAWFLVRRRPRLAIAVAMAAALVIAPWTIRNVHTYGRLVLIASEGGVTFWTGNHPLARGEGDLAANPEIKRAELELRGRHPGYSAEELEALYYREAFDWIAGHPGDWLALTARKAFYTVVPAGPSYAVHSATYQVASIAAYLLTLPFAVAGLGRLWRSPRRPSALLLVAGSSLLVCLVFFPQERFRLPVIDPVLIVCAAASGRAVSAAARGRSSES